jgi:cyclic pyranopterin phosphate synthase
MTVLSRHPPLTLRLSTTDRCQLRCSYCMPRGGVSLNRHEDVLSFDAMAAFVGALQRSFRLKTVRLTGGDPLVRKNVDRLVAKLADLRVPDIAMTTNGQLLAPAASALRDAGLHRLNISLDSLDSETFERLTGGGSLRRTLAGIAEARRVGFAPIKLNMVVLQGTNDHELVDMVKFALEQGCELRFLELMPIGVAARDFPDRFVPEAEIHRRLRANYALVPEAPCPGSTSSRFQVHDRSGYRGRIGFISAHSRPFCRDCRRLRLTATGLLIGCLARGEGVSLKTLLDDLKSRSRQELERVIVSVLRSKRVAPDFSDRHSMAAVGG